jgi:two-component system, LytTR family, sensor kinase
MAEHSPNAGCAEGPLKQRRHWIELSDLNWLLVFLLYTVAGLISAGTVFTSDLAAGGHQPYQYPLLWEMTGHYTAFLLVPLIILGFSRLPITRGNWFWSIPVHLAISIAFGLAHTVLMFLSRQAAYGLLGWGHYDYGHFGYRLLMEYHKQLLHYWLVYAVLRGLALYRISRERERAASALELKTSELQRQLAQVQLQALRSQLNPHFLFNTLNMISSVMYEDVDRADHMIAALSRMLRMSLDEHVSPEVPLRRELDFLDAARELLQARFRDHLELEVHCPPGLADASVPSLLLHTLIENAVKHHHNGNEPVIRVQVRIEAENGSLHLHVLDNGPGIADPDSVLGKGVGLANTRQRLRALYGENFRLDLVNRSEGGLHVHIVLPLRDAPALQPA